MKRSFYVMFMVLLFTARGVLASDATASEMQTEKQTVTHFESRSSFSGQEKYFTGKVKVDMLFSTVQDLPVSGAYVTFDAGARSAWHTHPAG